MLVLAFIYSILTLAEYGVGGPWEFLALATCCVLISFVLNRKKEQRSEKVLASGGSP